MAPICRGTQGQRHHSQAVLHSLISQPRKHTVTRSRNDTVTQSPSHRVTQSHSHKVTVSHSHTVTVAWSPSHSHTERPVPHPSFQTQSRTSQESRHTTGTNIHKPGEKRHCRRNGNDAADCSAANGLAVPEGCAGRRAGSHLTVAKKMRRSAELRRELPEKSGQMGSRAEGGAGAQSPWGRGWEGVRRVRMWICRWRRASPSLGRATPRRDERKAITATWGPAQGKGQRQGQGRRWACQGQGQG